VPMMMIMIVIIIIIIIIMNRCTNFVIFLSNPFKLKQHVRTELSQY